MINKVGECAPRAGPLLGPLSVGQAWSTLSIFLILIRASPVYQWRIQGTGLGVRIPIRPDAYLRLKFLHRQDLISLFNWLIFFNETRVAFCH